MSIQSLSFYQQDQNYWSQSQSFSAQDQNYWSQAQAQSQASSADASLINSMGAAETNEVKGLASIANQTALNRVNSQISALVQQALQSSSSSSTSSSSSGSTATSSAPSSSSSTSSSSPSPATGTGKVPVTTSTPLSSLGILAGGTITVTAGTNATTYTSTGNDTIGDLIGALNIDLPTNANVTASLNNRGQLVITGRNAANSISVGGMYASNIGFGLGNNSFSPVTHSSTTSANSSATGAKSTESSSASSSSTASSKSKSSKSALPSYLASSEQGVSTALGVLAADGVSGSLVNLLA